MLGLVASIHVLNAVLAEEDVDRRDKPDHDAEFQSGWQASSSQAFASPSTCGASFSQTWA